MHISAIDLQSALRKSIFISKTWLMQFSVDPFTYPKLVVRLTSEEHVKKCLKRIVKYVQKKLDLR